ncbi:MAG TPA: hypothetical protein VLA89_13365 [Gemmatimonadales bacterium]|nr:hypothetical protein [Gemmatimonadales bacterium]
MSKRIGLFVGREWSFPPAFMEAVSQRNAGVVVEYVSTGALSMTDTVPYDVLIDRISHEVPFYRSYLKHAVLQGVPVINNPFMWTADDKFFGASLITKLGLASPKTMLLPNKDYIPGIKHDESLRNLQFPLDWEGIARNIGMPCILKDAHGGGWKEVHVCRSLEELIARYDQSGLLTMIVQEFINWDEFVRCLCIGQKDILPIKYDPRERRYIPDDDFLAPPLRTRVINDARTICRALGYDMNSIEFAIRDGVPYAIDFMNPAPDMDINSLTPRYFDWVVQHMGDLAIALAKKPRRQVKDLKWDKMFVKSRKST